MLYHIGFEKDGDRLIIHAAQDVDALPCELWIYKGQRDITRARLHARRHALRLAVNATYGTAFTRVCLWGYAGAGKG
jgi:hypothetical protein